MPSKKVLIISILCLGMVTSIWLFQRSSGASPELRPGIVSGNARMETAGGDDWKKLLTSVDATTEIASSLQNKNPETFDETTLTAQMAKDFLSQYLLLKKGGQTLSSTDKNQIVSNLLASPEYSKTGGPVYIASNLEVISKTDSDTLREYRDRVNLSLRTRSLQLSGSPVSILNTALQSDAPTILSRLDPIIAVGKGFVSDFLNMEVPKNAVEVHLGLLNAISNLLFDLETMKGAFADPVGSLSGIANYNTHMVEFQAALVKINAFFSQKLGSS